VTPTLRPIRASFLVFGFFAGAWAVAAVDIEREFELTDAQLGFLLAGGIVLGTAFAALGGAMTDRFGAGHVLARSLAIWGALIAVQGFAPALGVFAPALTLGLAAGGLVDVVMNVIGADALASEPARLVRLHGLYNGGAVLGAAACGLALHADVSWRVVWIGVAVFAIALAAMTDRATVPEPARVEHPSMLRAIAGLRHEGLLVLALVFGGAAMVKAASRRGASCTCASTWGSVSSRASAPTSRDNRWQRSRASAGHRSSKRSVPGARSPPERAWRPEAWPRWRLATTRRWPRLGSRSHRSASPSCGRCSSLMSATRRAIPRSR
jgi:MFS family permease